LKHIDISQQITQQFHALDCRNCFVGIEVYITSKSEFLVKNKTFQVSLRSMMGPPRADKSRGRELNAL